MTKPTSTTGKSIGVSIHPKTSTKVMKQQGIKPSLCALTGASRYGKN